MKDDNVIYQQSLLWMAVSVKKDEVFIQYESCPVVETSSIPSADSFILSEFFRRRLHPCFIIKKDTSTLSLLFSVCSQWPSNVNSALWCGIDDGPAHTHTHTHTHHSKLLSGVPAVHKHFNFSICQKHWRKIYVFLKRLFALLLSFLFSLWDIHVVLVSVYWWSRGDTPVSDSAEQTFAVIDAGRRREYSIRKYCSPWGFGEIFAGFNQPREEKNTVQKYQRNLNIKI